jgi:hypothetical protein
VRSPGRPSIRRDVERAFWRKITEGLMSEDAAVACGVSVLAVAEVPQPVIVLDG